MALAGIQESFGKAVGRTLAKLAGLRLSESTVERTTEAAGARLADELRGGAVFGADRAWDWHTDADGRTCAYVSVDATGVLIQGPGGAKADGRMAWVGNFRPAAVYETKRLAFEAGLRQRHPDIIRFVHGASSSRKVYTSSFIPNLHDVCVIFDKPAATR